MTTYEPILAAWAVDHTEVESGWGSKPYGVTLHATKELAETYIREEKEKLYKEFASKKSPGWFVRVEDYPRLVTISAEEWEKIKTGKVVFFENRR